MYLSLTKNIIAAILGAILVKESENASNLYDRVREKTLATIRKNFSDKVKETIYTDKHREYTEKWRGNTIVDITPAAKLIPMYRQAQGDRKSLK